MAAAAAGLAALSLCGGYGVVEEFGEAVLAVLCRDRREEERLQR